MNKEVIYLEPEDDITDILTKLQQAEQKIVALVPPKKATMLRSTVNMKLVARVAKECEKVAVIVTADPAIVKMAMAARIPVAKTLNSRPVVPTEENVKAAAELSEDVIDEEALPEDGDLGKGGKKGKNASKALNSASAGVSAKTATTLELTEESLENDSKEAQNAKSKKKQPKNKENASFFEKYRKWIMIGSGAAVLLIVVLVWAFVFAPAVKITVAISSTPNNFSENVRFTTDQSMANLAENILYTEEIKLEKTYKTDIEATGEEDRGDKAKGKLTVSVTFRPNDYMGHGGYGVSVAAGDSFTNLNNGKVYYATEAKERRWDGENITAIECDNGTLTGGSAMYASCTLSVTVAVEAAEAGEKYDLPAGSRWSGNGISVSNGSPIIGGTTNMVKVISDEDVNKLKEAQLAEHLAEGQEDLVASINSDMVAIESSFKGEVAEVKTTPEVHDEIKEDDKPSAEVKIVYSIYAIKRSEIEEYIKTKMELPEDQKIYAYGSPYFERFTNIENEARLKTSVETGPTVTEEDILNKVKGMKTGQVQPTLKSINGVSSVNIETSYFWVWSVPKDPSRITIDLVVEEK